MLIITRVDARGLDEPTAVAYKQVRCTSALEFLIIMVLSKFLVFSSSRQYQDDVRTIYRHIGIVYMNEF
jgi:hypothetical protein